MNLDMLSPQPAKNRPHVVQKLAVLVPKDFARDLIEELKLESDFDRSGVKAKHFN